MTAGHVERGSLLEMVERVILLHIYICRSYKEIEVVINSDSYTELQPTSGACIGLGAPQ